MKKTILLGVRFNRRTSTSDNGISLEENKLDILFFVKSDFPDNPVKNKYSDKPKYKLLQNKEKAILRVRDNKIYGLNGLVFNNGNDYVFYSYHDIFY